MSDSELLDDIPADAVTGNLRTQDNTLSLWEVADDPGEAVLALVCGKQRLDTLDVVMLDKELVQSRGLEVVEKLGETPVSELAKMHRDLVGLAYRSLGTVASIVVESIQMGLIKRYHKKDLVEIVQGAVQQHRVALDQLADGVRRQILK